MPAERALSERFATTRITIKEALSSLEADGLIYRAERRGWFVAPPRLTYDPAIHTHFHQWIGEQQRTAETRVLAHGSELASSELCRWMGLDPFTPLYEIRRLRLIDGRPVLHVSHHLLASRFPDIASAPLASSLTELYQQRYGIGQGGASLEITPRRRGDHRPRPQSGGGEPVLRLVRVNYDERGRWWIAISNTGDRMQFESVSIREHCSRLHSTGRRRSSSRIRGDPARSGGPCLGGKEGGGSRRIRRDQLSILGIRSSKLW